MPIPTFYQYSQGGTANLHRLALGEGQKAKHEHHWEVGMVSLSPFITSSERIRLFSPSIHPLPMPKSKHWFTCNPGNVGRIGTREPVGRNKVVQAKGIKPNLKGAEVQVAVRTLVAPRGRWVCENGSAAVAPCLDQHRLRQLEVEVCGCL